MSLRRFEDVHRLRREKLREFYTLRRLINQASHILIELKNEFPHVEARLARIADKEEPEQTARNVLSATEESELHRLDAQLGEIERKLREL